MSITASSYKAIETCITGAGRALSRRHHFGRCLSDNSRDITLSAYDPEELLPTHEHATSHLCMVLSGGFLQTSAGKERVIQPGQVGIYPSGHCHKTEFGRKGAFCVNLHVPDYLAPDDFRIAPIGPRQRLAVADLATAVAVGQEADNLSIEGLVAELLACPDEIEPAASFPLHKLLALLEEKPSASLIELSKRVGRHPTHLARAFRNSTGFSVGTYRRRLRVRNLCVDLKSDGASLCELAGRHGYSDQAHMNREFKHFTGQSPGAWRKAR